MFMWSGFPRCVFDTTSSVEIEGASFEFAGARHSCMYACVSISPRPRLRRARPPPAPSPLPTPRSLRVCSPVSWCFRNLRNPRVERGPVKHSRKRCLQKCQNLGGDLGLRRTPWGAGKAAQTENPVFNKARSQQNSISVPNKTGFPLLTKPVPNKVRC